MAQPYPISRETREEAIFLGDGGKDYGPFDLKIFDEEDVKVYTLLQDAVEWLLQSVTVTKTSDAAFDTFSISFAANVATTTKIKVQAARVHERSAGLSKGVLLDPDALEKELSKQGTILQELARDRDRSVKMAFDAGSSGFTVAAGLAVGATLMLAAGGVLASGPNASDIQAAQGYSVAAQTYAQQAEEYWTDAASAKTDAEGARDFVVSLSSSLLRTDTGDQGLDVVSKANGRANLGLGSVAVQDANNVSISGGTLFGLPSLSASVQGTGLAGLDGGKWFLWNSQTAYDTKETLRIDRHMAPTSTSGVSGNTYGALWVNGSVGRNVNGWEWIGKITLDNYASGALATQNVALNATAFVRSNGVDQTGATWGANAVVDDRTGTVNPSYGRIGIEIDCYALGTGGTDVNKQRVGAQIAVGTSDATTPSTTLHIGRGILVGSNSANTVIDRLMEVSGSGSYGIGIDTTAATFASPVLLMAATQRIAFDGNSSGVYNRSLFYSSGVLYYATANGNVVSIADSGQITSAAAIYSSHASSVANTVRGFREVIDGTLYMALYHDNSKICFDVGSTTKFTLSGTINSTINPLQLPTYTVATLPTASSYPRCVVYVSDGTANKRLAISDGTNWRFPDGAIVS